MCHFFFLIGRKDICKYVWLVCVLDPVLNPEWTLGWEDLSGLKTQHGTVCNGGSGGLQHCRSWIFHPVSSCQREVEPFALPGRRWIVSQEDELLFTGIGLEPVLSWDLSWKNQVNPGNSVWTDSPFSAVTFFRELSELLNKSQIQINCYHKARTYKNVYKEEGTTSPQNKKIKYTLILLLWRKEM